LRILFLAHRVPYPPDKGDKIRSYHELRHLAARHRMTLVALADRREDLGHERPLREMAEEVHLVPLSPLAGKMRSLLALPSGASLSVRYFATGAFARAVGRLLREKRFDAIFAYSSSVATVCCTSKIPSIVDFVDVDSEKFAQYSRSAREPMASIYRTEARRLRAFEKDVSERAPLTLVCTNPEAEVLRAFARPRRLEVVENGVDLDRFPGAFAADAPPLAVFVGAMDYLANVDACEFFVREVMPRVVAELPDFRLRIVGRHPTPRVRALHDGGRVVVVGGVPDVGVEMRGAAVSVAPLRVARGIQNKVLEAMASGTAVVASPSAAQGIGATPGEHLLVAEDPESWARAVLSVIRDRQLAARLSRSARALVEERFRWGTNLARLDALVEATVAEAAATGRGAR
jgi:sugar transferase (PEP-CTERM/EpsH1 system associated)